MKTLPGFPLVDGNHVTFTALLLMLVVVKFGATGAENRNIKINRMLPSNCPIDSILFQWEGPPAGDTYSYVNN